MQRRVREAHALVLCAIIAFLCAPAGQLWAAYIVSFVSAVNYSVGTTPVAIAVGDFNADGVLDLVVVNGSSNTVSVLLGNGNGTFKTHIDYTVIASRRSCRGERRATPRS